MAMPLNMILVVCHTMYIVIYDFNKLTFLYIYMYIYLSYYYDKEVCNDFNDLFLSIKYLSVCHKWLSKLFRLYLNTYDIGLRKNEMFLFFQCCLYTSTDVRF